MQAFSYYRKLEKCHFCEQLPESSQLTCKSLGKMKNSSIITLLYVTDFFVAPLKRKVISSTAGKILNGVLIIY